MLVFIVSGQCWLLRDSFDFPIKLLAVTPWPRHCNDAVPCPAHVTWLGVEQRAGQQVGGEFLLWSLPDVETTVISRRDQEPGHRQDMTPKNLQRWIFLLPPCCCCWAPPLLSPADDHLNSDSSSQHWALTLWAVSWHILIGTLGWQTISSSLHYPLSPHTSHHDIITFLIQLQSVKFCQFPS